MAWKINWKCPGMSWKVLEFEKFFWVGTMFIADNFTNIWTSSQIFFNIILPPPASQSTLMFSTPVGNPGISTHWGDGKYCCEGNFYVVVGIWGGVILTIQTFFKAKKQHIVKIPPVGVKVKFCREEEEILFYWLVEI